MAASSEKTSSSSSLSIRVLPPTLEARTNSLCSTSVEDAQRRGGLFSLDDLQAMAKSVKIPTSQSKSSLITAIREKATLKEALAKSLISEEVFEVQPEPEHKKTSNTLVVWSVFY